MSNEQLDNEFRVMYPEVMRKNGISPLIELSVMPALTPGWATVLTLSAGAAIPPLALLPGLAPAYGWDGPAHVAAFSLLALPVALSGPAGLRVALPALALLGAGLELLQGVTGRDPSLADAGMNLLGLLLGALLGLMARRALRTRRRA